MRLADLHKKATGPAAAIVPIHEPEIVLDPTPAVEEQSGPSQEIPAEEPATKSPPSKNGNGLDPLLAELVESSERVREPQAKAAASPAPKPRPLKRWGFVAAGLAALVGVLVLARGSGSSSSPAAAGVTRMPPIGGGSGYVH